MYYVYILYSKEAKSFYTGMSLDPSKRLSEHNKGNTKSTRFGRPWLLFYKERCKDRASARRRERYWKSGSGREKRDIFLSSSLAR